MRTKQARSIPLIILAAAFFLAAPRAAADEAPVYDTSVLDGEWRVVSSTWGGDPGDFLGATYTLKIRSDSVKTGTPDGDPTQFLIDINGGSGFASAINNTFCGMRYALLPNSFSFYFGYPMLIFWQLDEYPCVGDEDYHSVFQLNEVENGVLINNSRELIRFDVVSPEKAHAVIYYEGTGYTLSVESQKEDVFAAEEQPTCAKGVCVYGLTMWTGIFELELEKIGK